MSNLTQEGPVVARQAHLRYVNDDRPGIRRIASGRRFQYVDAKGKTVSDPGTLRRIKALAIPPAWQKVWICPIDNGHLQATGRDARGRKQYRYHQRWREIKDDTKYNRMLEFARALPQIRRRVAGDLRAKGLTKNKVMATVARLLEVSLIRVGNDEYAHQNHSYGLTTLKNRHARINGATIQFHFRGKAGKEHDIEVHDPRLARIVRACRDIPGQDLFQYYDDEGRRRHVRSQDLNDYLRDIAGAEFTAKDFRTWAGTVLAGMALREFEKFDSEAQAKKNLLKAIESVAGRLGNTPAICRKCYIHPEILDGYMQGATIETVRRKAEAELRRRLHALQPEEAAVVAFLQRRLARKREPLKKTLERSIRLVQRRKRQFNRAPEKAGA